MFYKTHFYLNNFTSHSKHNVIWKTSCSYLTWNHILKIHFNVNYVCLFHIYPPITGNIYKGSIQFQSTCVSGVSVYHYWDVLVAVKEETKATYGKVVVDKRITMRLAPILN